LRGTEEDWFGREEAPWLRGRAFSARGSGAASLPQRLPMIVEYAGQEIDMLRI
jgi:hypothetical protein